jgi:hypothetical protein
MQVSVKTRAGFAAVSTRAQEAVVGDAGLKVRTLIEARELRKLERLGRTLIEAARIANETN